jgi:catechol 2,3-dioxygenase-like lactoylglutathione lyase family enzyme
MRLDHVAYRVSDRDATAQFFIDAFGYRKQVEFEITLEDGSKAACVALEPPEKKPGYAFVQMVGGGFSSPPDAEFHMPPEIFVSSGPPGSIIDKWVQARGGVGGIHHLAYQVDDVQAKVDEWRAKGWLFTTPAPLQCEGLTQIFSMPHQLTGVVFEFIKRSGQHGFCKNNVAKLMGSTKGVN